MRERLDIGMCTYKVRGKSLVHFVFPTFFHQRLLIIKIRMVVSIALGTRYKSVIVRTLLLSQFKCNRRDRFCPAEKILAHFQYFIDNSFMKLWF